MDFHRIHYCAKKYSYDCLRLSIGIIFIWFGILKCLKESPAQDLVMHALPWSANLLWVFWIGIWEVLIGLCFIIKKTLKFGLVLFFLHIPGTFLPLIFAPEHCFISAPFLLTLEGQYIFKNLITIASAFVLVGSLEKK